VVAYLTLERYIRRLKKCFGNKKTISVLCFNFSKEFLQKLSFCMSPRIKVLMILVLFRHEEKTC